MLYRSGDVVYVQPVMWVAQLQAAIIREKQIVNGRRVTLVVNVDRVPCRYFVNTAQSLGATNMLLNGGKRVAHLLDLLMQRQRWNAQRRALAFTFRLKKSTV